ncbi:MAG: PepSY-like domain-containing protein [Zavarzinella sp.]|nr:PepSY-like domain-containing protein [Zavarzinella sp.]
MRGLTSWCGAVVVAGLFLAGTAAGADEKTKEEKISADKLPRAVMAAVKAHFPDPEFTSLTKETTGDKVVYDIELKQKGKKHEMDIREDGTVLEIENEVPAKDLPDAVTKALDAKFPKATVAEVMEVNKVTGKEIKFLHYELTIETAEKKKLEVVITADGKSVKVEEEEKK